MNALSPVSAATFITAGKATLTVESKRTGKHFTYQIKGSDDGAVHFVSLLTGPNNSRDYSYIGIIRSGRFQTTHRSTVSSEAPAARGMEWLMRHVSAGTLDGKPVKIMHHGKCGRCGRKLTRPESIGTGLGPVCSQLIS